MIVDQRSWCSHQGTNTANVHREMQNTAKLLLLTAIPTDTGHRSTCRLLLSTPTNLIILLPTNIFII